MLTQLFKYRKLVLTINGIKYPVNVPFYGDTTYLAMDPDGSLFAYDVKPVFDHSKQQYTVDSNKQSYDIVAKYEGDTSKLYKNVIALVDKQYTYTLMEN